MKGVKRRGVSGGGLMLSVHRVNLEWSNLSFRIVLRSVYKFR